MVATVKKEKPPSTLGIILVWIGSLIWCFELLMGAWPSGLYFILVPLGMILTLLTAFRHSDWKPFAIALAAFIPPILVLAARGFRI